MAFGAFDYVTVKTDSEKLSAGGKNTSACFGDIRIEMKEEEILSDTDYVLKLTEGVDNLPFMVIDDCWQEHHRLNEYNGGPWRCGNSKFPDMKGLADKLTAKGVRPGIWVRLLQNEDEAIPDEWRLPMNGCLDPSHHQRGSCKAAVSGHL